MWLWWSLLARASANEVPTPVDPAWEQTVDRRRAVTASIVRVEGGLVLGVSALHFAAMPLLDNMMQAELSPEEYRFFRPMFMLNHAVVGVLLIPVAIGNLYAAGGLRRGERWAWVVATMNATVLLSLPAVMAATMGPEYFRAVPFATAAGTITAVGATQWIPLVAWRGSYR